MQNYFLARNAFTWSFGTTSSLKEYAPVLGDLTILITLVKSFAPPLPIDATTFFAIIYELQIDTNITNCELIRICLPFI